MYGFSSLMNVTTVFALEYWSCNGILQLLQLSRLSKSFTVTQCQRVADIIYNLPEQWQAIHNTSQCTNGSGEGKKQEGSFSGSSHTYSLGGV